MNSFEIYNEIEGNLQAIYRSRLLTEILLSLNENSRKLSQLREITEPTSNGSLIASDLVIKVPYYFFLRFHPT